MIWRGRYGEGVMERALWRGRYGVMKWELGIIGIEKIRRSIMVKLI